MSEQRLPPSGHADPSVAILSQIRCFGMRKAVCWDKDSTLANTSHRHWMVRDVMEGRRTWIDYALNCAADTPVHSARALMHLLAPSSLQVVTSGAHFEAMVPVGKWILGNQFPVDMIRLRRDQEMKIGPAQLKIRMIEELREEGYEVVLFVEDNLATAIEIEEVTEVPTLCLNPRYSPRSQGIVKEFEVHI
jgi:hypothetical protein